MPRMFVRNEKGLWDVKTFGGVVLMLLGSVVVVAVMATIQDVRQYKPIEPADVSIMLKDEANAINWQSSQYSMIEEAVTTINQQGDSFRFHAPCRLLNDRLSEMAATLWERNQDERVIREIAVIDRSGIYIELEPSLGEIKTRQMLFAVELQMRSACPLAKPPIDVRHGGRVF